MRTEKSQEMNPHFRQARRTPSGTSIPSEWTLPRSASPILVTKGSGHPKREENELIGI